MRPVLSDPSGSVNPVNRRKLLYCFARKTVRMRQRPWGAGRDDLPDQCPVTRS